MISNEQEKKRSSQSNKNAEWRACTRNCREKPVV